MSGLEVAGLAIGVLGLLGLFKDCIDTLSFVSAARSRHRDLAILSAKLDLEKAQILNWAHRVRLTRSDYDRRLDDPATREANVLALRSIRELFADAARLRDQYGVVLADNADTTLGTHAIASLRLDAFNVDIQESSSTSLKKGCKWAIRDKEKFEALLNHLHFFSDKLDRLIPPARLGDDNSLLANMPTTLALKQTKIMWDACSGHWIDIEPTARLAHAENARRTVLNALWFRSMDERRDSLQAPHPCTFEWIFRPRAQAPTWSSLPDWLEGGSGVYWVSGKPASGKSTMMKFILNHESTKSHLSEWSSSCPLSVHSFFFRGLGESDRRSHDGLARAILYNFLKTESESLAEVLPTVWKEVYDQAEPHPALPSDTEIHSAFRAIARSSTSRKFCFFIDGLDEYEGPHQKAIELIQLLAQSPNIKFIVSSRPITACWTAFANGPMLRLEHLNRPDITEYVHNNIGAHTAMARLLEKHPNESRSLLKELIDKSQGVFLWVVVACRSLIAGFADGDFIRELRARIAELPRALEELFDHIMSKLDKRHRAEAAFLIRLVFESRRCHVQDGELLTHVVDLLAENNFSTSAVTAATIPRASDIRGHCLNMDQRLRSRCYGLLETTHNIFELEKEAQGLVCYLESYRESKIRFIHRTFFEYLQVQQEHGSDPSSEHVAGWDVSFVLALYACTQLTDPHLVRNYLIKEAKKPETTGFRSYTRETMHTPDRAPQSSSMGDLTPKATYFPDGLRESTFSWVQCIFDFARRADPTSYEHIHELLSVIIRRLRGVSGIWQQLSLQPYLGLAGLSVNGIVSDVGVAVLAVEAGLSNMVCADTLWPAWTDCFLSTSIPWLYYAVAAPAFGLVVQNIRQTPPFEVIEYLLQAGCDPNAPHDGEDGKATPWISWLGLLRTLRREHEACDQLIRYLEATSVFIKATADPDKVIPHLGKSIQAWVEDLVEFHSPRGKQFLKFNEARLRKVWPVFGNGEIPSHNTLDFRPKPFEHGMYGVSSAEYLAFSRKRATMDIPEDERFAFYYPRRHRKRLRTTGSASDSH